jgi:hypothetical protein
VYSTPASRVLGHLLGELKVNHRESGIATPAAVR